MNRFKLAPLFFILPLAASAIGAQPSDESSTLKSLDSITAQSSGVPALLLAKPVDLPAPVVTPSGKAKKPYRKNVSHPVNPPSQKAPQADAASQVAWTQEKAALLKAAAENRNQIEQLQAQLNAANNRAVSGVDQEALKQTEAWKTQLAEMKKPVGASRATGADPATVDVKRESGAGLESSAGHAECRKR